MKLAIFGCFNTPIIETTTTGLLPTTGSKGTVPATEISVTEVKSSTGAVTTGVTTITSAPGTTGTPSSSTTVLPPITTTMSYCTEQKGMNQPLPIQPTQVTSNPPPEQTTPTGDINPESPAPGLNYPSMYPQINVTLVQPATLTLIYVPVDRLDRPSNVDKFVVKFVYPDGTTPSQFTSEIPSKTETTISSGTTTTPSTKGVFPPSDASPRVNLPPKFELPTGTIVVIDVISTRDEQNAKQVRMIFIVFRFNDTR